MWKTIYLSEHMPLGPSWPWWWEWHASAQGWDGCSGSKLCYPLWFPPCQRHGTEKKWYKAIFSCGVWDLQVFFEISTVGLTFSIGPGQLLPVASTGMSSYFSKLIPVLLPENSSLRASDGETERRRERETRGLVKAADGLFGKRN